MLGHYDKKKVRSKNKDASAVCAGVGMAKKHVLNFKGGNLVAFQRSHNAVPNIDEI